MEIGSKFIQLWQSYFAVISVSVYSLVLVVVEYSMDPNFKCPEEKTWRFRYSLCYILIPPVALFLLGVVVQLPSRPKDVLCCECRRDGNGRIALTDSKRKKCAKVRCICLKSVTAMGLWIIIILLDGKYIDCLCKSFKVNGLADNPEARSVAYYRSQMTGLGLILAVIVLWFAWWLCRKRPSQRITLDAGQSKGLLQKEAAEYITKQSTEAMQKLIEKHLKDTYVDTATLLTGLTDEQIATEIEVGFNIVRETQAPAAGNRNSNGGAGSSSGGNSTSRPEIQSRDEQAWEFSDTSPEGASSSLLQEVCGPTPQENTSLFPTAAHPPQYQSIPSLRK